MKERLTKLINNPYVFSVMSKVIHILAGIIFSIIYSRYLGPELRGVAAIINNYGEVASLILCLGVFQAYPYFKVKYKKDLYHEFIDNMTGMYLVYTLISVILIVSLRERLSNILIVAILIAPVWMCSRQYNYLTLIEHPKKSNMSGVKRDFFDILIIALLSIFTRANFLICALFLIGRQVFYLGVTYFNLNVRLKEIHPTLKQIRPYVRYGIVPMLTLILMEFNYKIDIFMLEGFKISNAQIGIYSLGVMLAQKLWMLPDALKDILLSKLVKTGDTNEVAKVSRLSFFIMIFAMICMVIFGKTLIQVMYGTDYIDAYPVTLVILGGVLGMVFYKMVYSYNIANGHKNINFILLAIAAMVNVVLNAFLIPAQGTFGAAIASLISYSVCGISFLLYFCGKTKVGLADMVFVKKSDITSIFRFLKVHRS